MTAQHESAATGVGAPVDPQQALWHAELERCANGDRDAFRRFYQSTRPRVEAFLFRQLRDAADVSEALNDTYRQAWRFAHRYDAQRASVIGWLITLARSQAIDRFRQRGAAAPLAADFDEATEAIGTPSHEDPSRRVDQAQRTSALGRALTLLTTRGRRAVRLSVVEQLTHTEIAEATGEPLGTVKSRIRRALIHVREVLQRWGIDRHSD
jgi:RNA polymerase sigma-70 factor (ECF subfamily)